MEPEVKKIEVEVLPPSRGKEHDFVRVLAYLLDDFIPIPGTKYRIGLDPIIGLIPGVGDTSAAAVSSLILVRAFQSGVPRVVLAHMTANLLLNVLVGAIPFVGDLFSAWFKSNQRNYSLLLKHESHGKISTTGDWTFLIILLAVILIVVVAAALAAGYLAYQILTFIFGGW